MKITIAVRGGFFLLFAINGKKPIEWEEGTPEENISLYLDEIDHDWIDDLQDLPYGVYECDFHPEPMGKEKGFDNFKCLWELKK